MKIRKSVKRCLTLCVSLVLALVLALPAPAVAAMFPWGVPTYYTSQEGVDFIKGFEGFRAQAYLDNGRWYIGYGVLCEPSDYPYGIDEAQGEALLQAALADKELQVNQMLQEQNLYVTQQQFDVLVSLTYNLGKSWMTPGYRFYDCLLSGYQNYTEEEIVNFIGGLCHQSGKTLKNLVNRRLKEAFLFLYGQYDNNAPSLYTYVDYDAAGGTVEPNMTQFYRVGTVYGQLPVPTWAGRTFLGWYTSDGRQFTGSETALEPLSVTAQWYGVAAPAGPGTTGTVTPAAPPIDYSSWVNPFSDVQDTDWYFTYVRELNYKKIVTGFPDGTFRGKNTVSAGEALKLVMSAATGSDPGNAPSGHWAGLYLSMAEQMGCLLPGEITDLNEPIDRQTVARIASIALGLTLDFGYSPFADTTDPYVLSLYNAGIVEGSLADGMRYFSPLNSISRAEISAIVVRISNWNTVSTQPQTPAVQQPEPNDPAKSGYIEYGSKRIPVLPTVTPAPYDPDLFVRNGSEMYYLDPAYRPEVGIDVSRHQGTIDWWQVAASGMVDFAVLRVGGQYYGKDNGELYADANFEANLIGARSAGLKVGAYFYSAAVSVEEARQQALYVLELLNGVPLEYPVVYDWEVASSARNSDMKLPDETATDCAIAFCETIAAAGYTPMIYVGLDVAYNRLDLSRLGQYDRWMVQYPKDNRPTMYYDYRVWQYTDSGTVPGIEGKVDMNIALIPY